MKRLGSGNRTRKLLLKFCAGWAIGGALAMPAVAHHSAAAFDATRTLAISGTIKRFEWSNPHVWIVLAPQAGGTAATRYECAAPGVLARSGWTEDTLHEGETVMLSYHPRRDGSPGGQFASAILPDGRQIGGRLGARP